MEVYSHRELSDMLQQRDNEIPLSLCFTDHISGFDSAFHNIYLDKLSSFDTERNIYYDWPLEDNVHELYDNLNIKFKLDKSSHMQNMSLLTPLLTYRIHPTIEFDNFLCSFNGSDGYGRQFLVSALYKYGWFNKEYCSKNFSSSCDTIDGNMEKFLDGDDLALYRNIIIRSTSSDDFSEFLNNTNGFSFDKSYYDYPSDISYLEDKLSRSFVNLISETVSESYHPFVTEKSIYSIVTRGLFITYGQPHWHSHVEKYYGFKKYNKIFDYSFDEITNPIKRLIEILTMLHKFSLLSKADWNDLYLMEQDTIEYNYDHYFSKNFLDKLRSYENV